MSKHTFCFETVIYYNDVETDARWEACRELIKRTAMDAVTFYYIREYELRHLPLKTIRPRIERMAACAAELRAAGIETAAALLPALSWGQVAEEGPYQKITGADGTRSGIGSCPLDESLRADMLQITQWLCAAGFEAVSLEDDFQTDNHRPVRGGCFCALHLEAFSNQEGCAWEREALVGALAEDADLAARWGAFKLDILADLAKQVQDAADGLPICLLGGADVQRNPLPLFRKLKMEYWRPVQGQYTDQPYLQAPVMGAFNGASNHHTFSKPMNIRSMAEISGWPRNAYAKCWSTMKLQAMLSAFFDLEGVLLWVGHGPRDTGFEKAVTEMKRLCEVMHRCAEAYPRLRGIHTSSLSPGPRAMARMGLPMTFDDQCADAVYGQEVLDCEAITRFSPGGVVMQPAPFFASERPNGDPINGDDAGWPSTCLTLLREDDFQRVTVDGDARVLSYFLDNDSNEIAEAVLLQQNRVIFNHSPALWDKLISPIKARQVRAAVEAAMGKALPVVAVGAPDVLVFVRDNHDGSERVVLVVNLSLDTAEDWALELDREAKGMFIADERGVWDACDHYEPMMARTARLYRFTF